MENMVDVVSVNSEFDVIKSFIQYQLDEMTEQMKRKYDIREQNNPFKCFGAAGDIAKYMSLGRSFDSQLGTRMQKICMFLARERYGKENVPDYVFICASEDEKKVTMWTYNYDEACVSKNNLYKTQTVMYVSSYDDVKKRAKNYKLVQAKEYIYENCTDEQIRNVTEAEKVVNAKRSRKLPIDLIAIPDHDHILLFEVKLGGGLDTKNRQANATEVLDNKKSFSFVSADESNVGSYFASCYNGSGNDDGVSEVKKEKGIWYRGEMPVAPMFDIINEEGFEDLEMRIGSVFFDLILPDGIGYPDFIRAYNEAFAASEIEKKISEM